jgi:hypothetical protein
MEFTLRDDLRALVTEGSPLKPSASMLQISGDQHIDALGALLGRLDQPSADNPSP